MKRLALCLALLAALVVAGGCAAPSPTPTPTKAPAPAAAAPTVPPSQKEVVLMGFGGVQETAFKEDIIPPFEKKYGVKVTWVTAASGTAAAAKIIAQKDAPEVDVLYLSNPGFLQLKAAGVLSKIDPARVPNYEDLYDIFKDPDRLGACQAQMPSGIIYNSKIFKEKGLAPPTSWYDLWRPELKGRVGILSIANSTSMSVIPVIAKAESGDSKNIDAAFTKFKALVPNLLAIAPSSGAAQELFKREEIWVLALDGNYVAAGLQKQGFPAEFVYPKEGSPFFSNNYIIPKGAPHAELGQEFVNYAIGPDAQLAWAKATWFGPCNKTVKLPADLAEKVTYGPEKIAKLFPTDWPWIVSNFDAWADRWNREIERK